MVYGWMRRVSKTRIKKKGKRGGNHQPLCGTWVADFMLRQDPGRFMLGKYVNDRKIPSSNYLQNIYQKIFKICIKTFSERISKYLENISSELITNVSKIIPKPSTKSCSSSQNLRISLKTQIYPPKKIIGMLA